MEKSKVDLRKLNIAGGIGLLLSGANPIFPTLSLIGLIIEAVVMYQYSKILKNPKIWTMYLLYLAALLFGSLILFGFGEIFDKIAKINDKLAFGLIALIVMIAMFFYRKVYKELGLSIKHNYFVKASDFIIVIIALAIVMVFLSFDNPRIIDMEIDLGQFVVFTILAVGYFTAPKELYLDEEITEKEKDEVSRHEA
jgi:uncharacterized membrane protein